MAKRQRTHELQDQVMTLVTLRNKARRNLTTARNLIDNAIKLLKRKVNV